VCAVLVVLVVAFLAYMIYPDNREQKAQAEAMEELQAEARPYEVELQNLKSELQSLQNSVSYSSEEAEILVGFVASDESADSYISYIDEKASAYNFSPVLIVDCTMDMDIIEEIIDAADESWEIMLYASSFSEEVNDSVLSVISYLASINREHCGIFFLRGDSSTASNIQLLVDDGFIGYTDYNSESPKAGQTEDGSVYFDYSYLTTSGTTVSSRITALYRNKAAMIIAFDMASIQSGALTEAYVVSLLDRMQAYTENDDCSFSTVAAVTEKLSEINTIEAELQADYEAQAAEIQERIDELEELIEEIYAEVAY
ncbi:MAG: hypothetical protein LUH42_06610, partial [Oscillospiraceae bacterium]|nr:hypothetical protein [Oscillospiraceae bacterium]